MKEKKVLVAGAGIAGLTLAYWLKQYGFIVSVVERFPELRLGGQNIDVKGPALEIVTRINILDQIREANTTEVGLRWVNSRNKTIAEFPKDNPLSMTQEYEILRGDFVQILYDCNKNEVSFEFGRHITALSERPDGMNVCFSSGHVDVFHLVISAEGIGSSTRDLVLKDQVSFDYKGIYTSYLTIAKSDRDSRWARWCNAVRGIVFLLRPDNHGSTRVCINFLSPERGYERLPLEEQKKILADRIRGVGWESDRLIREIEQSEDLYLDRLSQVKAKRWHQGRFAIVGDAAYCATPLAGKGTDLAVAGAYIFAGELLRHDSHLEAFQAYEARMRPYVEKSQQLPPGVPRLVYPTSGAGVRILNGIVGLAGSPLMQGAFKLLGRQKKTSESPIELPRY